MAEPPNPNERDPWTEWRAANRWQSDLHRQAAHKALDIPEDMAVTTVNASRSGIGWRELVAIGATMAGLMGLGKGLGFFDQLPPPPQLPAAPPTIIAPQLPIGEPPRVTINQDAAEPRSYELGVSSGKLPGQSDR